MTPESVLWPLVAVVALLCGLKGWMVAHACRHDMKVQSAAITEPYQGKYDPPDGWAQFYRLGCVSVLTMCTRCGHSRTTTLAGKPVKLIDLLSSLVGADAA